MPYLLLSHFLIFLRNRFLHQFLLWFLLHLGSWVQSCLMMRAGVYLENLSQSHRCVHRGGKTEVHHHCFQFPI